MHFCCIWKWDGTYFYVNDPASAAANRAKGTETEVKNARKQFFIFYNEKKVEEPVPEPEPELVVTTPTKEVPVGSEIVMTAPNPNGKIIDISKWQEKINFDKLKPEVAFVIARASCGSDKDIRIDEYAKAMNERGIPFGVYCYSYAGTKEKAIDEAQKIVSYASPYNPLFYVVDAEESRLTNETIKAFAQELRKLTKKKIGCYVAHHRYNEYKYSTLQGLFDFTWIPCYGKNDGTISGAREPSYFCDLWQYTSTAKIAGINGNVDMNIITGKGHDLQWFLTTINEGVG